MAQVRYVASALLCGLLWAVPLRGQEPTGTITGQVTDIGTQQPLSGVIIRVQGTPLGTQTRSDGGFTLTDVPAGTHTVRVTRIGYAPLEQPVMSRRSRSDADRIFLHSSSRTWFAQLRMPSWYRSTFTLCGLRPSFSAILW